MSWTGVGVILLSAAVIAALAGLAWERRKAAQFQESVDRVERRVAEIVGIEHVLLENVPDLLRRVKEDVETVLAEVEDAGALGADGDGHGQWSQSHETLGTAIALLAYTAARIKKSSAACPIQRLEAALRLTSELQGTIDALKSARAQHEPAETLANMLRSGQLNHVLTTAPLLAVYFGDDDNVILLRAAYQAAAALIELALIESRIAVVVVPPLTTVARGASRNMGFEDQRGLRHVPAVRDQVVRAARDLAEGEQLIVDCLAPGWRAGSERQRPQIVGFSRADWMCED